MTPPIGSARAGLVSQVGDAIPDSVVESFESQNLNNWQGETSNYSIQSDNTFYEDYGAASTSAQHDVMWWDSSQFSGAKTGYVWFYNVSGDDRGGVSLTDANGNGYSAYNDDDAIVINEVNSTGVVSGAGSSSNLSLSDNTFYQSVMEYDGTESWTAKIKDQNGNVLDSVSTTDSSITPDRVGLHWYDGTDIDAVGLTD